MSLTDLIPLNRSEHLYWAAEGRLGPINQPYMLRLSGPVDAALVRQTLRELVTAFPRMRSVIEPGFWLDRMRILPDDFIVDQLFDDAYQVEHGVDLDDSDALQAWHSTRLNDPLSLEHGLPWRARFLPHPSQPGLLFVVHHIVGDGRSMIQMLCAILGRLNGQPISASPLDSPSMHAAVTPAHVWQWPAAIWRGWRQSRADARAAQGQQVITLNQRHSPRFTTSAIRYHELPCPAEVMKQLARANNCTQNALLTALIANTFLAPHAHNPHAVAALRISVDLRRYYPEGQAPTFGNYVATCTVRARHQPTLTAQIADIEQQIQQQLARFERRDHALPLTLYEWLPVIGRRRYGQLIALSKARGSLPDISCHFSNLGSAEFINPKNSSVRLENLFPATINAAFLLGALSLNGRQFLVVIRQCAEVDDATVRTFLNGFDQQFTNVQKSATPATPADTAPAKSR